MGSTEYLSSQFLPITIMSSTYTRCIFQVNQRSTNTISRSKVAGSGYKPFPAENAFFLSSACKATFQWTLFKLKLKTIQTLRELLTRHLFQEARNHLSDVFQLPVVNTESSGPIFLVTNTKGDKHGLLESSMTSSSYLRIKRECFLLMSPLNNMF